ncbi:MAG: hypothetical protein ACF8PN_02680 [Phycisphaerales bacterium]
MALELRDRYLEDLNEYDHAAAMPLGPFGKWDESRAPALGERKASG